MNQQSLIKGNAARAYDAYLADWQAKNPAVIQPEYVHYWGEGGRELYASFYASTEKLAGTLFRTNGALIARVLPDGRVAEQGFDSRGNDLFAVFPSREAHRAFQKPRSMDELFDRLAEAA